MELNKGDKVQTTDGSYAVKLSTVDWNDAYINSPARKGEVFTVIGFTYSELRTKRSAIDVHDIVIKSNSTGECYLHSSSMVKVIEPPKCPCCNRPLEG